VEKFSFFLNRKEQRDENKHVNLNPDWDTCGHAWIKPKIRVLAQRPWMQLHFNSCKKQKMRKMPSRQTCTTPNCLLPSLSQEQRKAGFFVTTNQTRNYLCRPQLQPDPRNNTPWQVLFNSRNDRAFITTMGFDVETFELCSGFGHVGSALFHAVTQVPMENHAQDGGP